MGTGCSSNTTRRVEQLPAVLLCRDRCKFLEEALHHSYALADAHLAYIRSLRTVGPALRRFFEIFPAASAATSDSRGADHDHSHNSVGDYDYCSMQGRDYEVMTSTIPAPPPTSWDYYFNLFDVDQYNSVVMKEKKQGETKSESEDQENIGDQSEERSNWSRELEDWFQKASDSGLQVVEMLDTRKFRYHYHPTSGYWKMIEGIISQDDELLMSTHNLSSTLRKLCMWEHKLLGEVRVEEKLCVLLHIKKLKKQTGGDESLGSYPIIRALYSKVKVAFHVIQNVFSTINNLTAEELWPHINQLIQRFSGMWELMSEIHRKQHQIVKAFCESKEANNFGVDKLEILDDDHLDQVAAAGLVLEQVVQNWSLNFSKWIKAQRACINALNAWLCINYDHDHKPAGEGDHDQASTSTTCMPLMFLIINEWSNAMNRVSEEQVVASLNAFSATIVGVLQLGDHQIMRHTAHDHHHHHVFTNTAVVAKQVGQGLTYKVEKQGGSDGSQLCCCLEQVFMAMEKLATDWKQAYQAIIAGHALETYKSVAP